MSEYLKPEHRESPKDKVELMLATDSDVGRLVDWDEHAARASNGSGFEPEERSRHEAAYREALHAPDIEVLLVRRSPDDTVGGAVVLQYDRSPESFTEVVKGPFREDGTEVPPREEILSVLANNDSKTSRAHMKSLALDPDRRGQGLGKKVIEAVRERLRARGVDILSFSTGPENTVMRKLVKDAVFIEVRSSRGGYKDTKLIGVVDLRV